MVFQKYVFQAHRSTITSMMNDSKDKAHCFITSFMMPGFYLFKPSGKEVNFIIFLLHCLTDKYAESGRIGKERELVEKKIRSLGAAMTVGCAQGGVFFLEIFKKMQISSLKPNSATVSMYGSFFGAMHGHPPKDIIKWNPYCNCGICNHRQDSTWIPKQIWSHRMP